ncbi:MAG: ABC transporter ATP-binding protein [Oscillospiraceae bacterium]|jgi:iron complex transport system ATP-binding protein|nr:ABC transporter ATP-binding protein [Oscillospiraceae bacterium]
MILEVKNLAFSYHKNDKQIFHDVNISLEAGEILTILGPNGAGKSTLLNCLANLLKPTRGEILLDGKSHAEMSLREVAQVLGYVPQNHAATYSYRVRDFVVMGRAPYLGIFEKPKRADYEIANTIIRELGIEKYADKPYTEISGGERQQAMIARAITQKPKIIMFDEPTNHLDFGNQMRTIMKIKDLASKGYAVIMTTHMPNHAIMLQGKTAILNRSGELICGETEQIVTDENLRDIYQVDVRVVDVAEAGGKLCVFAQNQLR